MDLPIIIGENGKTKTTIFEANECGRETTYNSSQFQRK
ncbi:hypothetical protein bthur0004_67200 [Bacillus thuringiensis serovar sotto str. T04001]|nr:hypothetical protein bthur0004_67200 [Bacillus thuringiensis serovar sotto str. T04001]